LKVDRSIAEAPRTAPGHTGSRARLAAAGVGLLLACIAFSVYWVSNPVHHDYYVHFVWQADAFLHGRAWFEYPIRDGLNTVTGAQFYDYPDNYYYQDVYPLTGAAGNQLGHVLLPFPPLPAIVLLPFVAVFGLFTDQEAVAILLGALGVLSTWWMLGGLHLRLAVRAVVMLIFATGTAWWWAAAVGTTWYFAHLVALNLAMLAVGVTLRHDPRAVDETTGEEEWPDNDGAAADAGRSYPRRLWAAAWPLDRSQMLAGLLLGLSVTARLSLVFAAPWFIFVGGGGGRLRRTVSTGVGAFLPVTLLLVYTFATTGSLLNPGYEYQYQLEAHGYPTLGYHPDWSIEDVRYIPQNLQIMLAEMPILLPDIQPNTLGFGAPVHLCQAPDSQRGIFDVACPVVIPTDIGTGLLLSAPGLLLALLAYRRPRLSRLKAGATLAVAIIALFNLAHFSQGWVQWGYRFSLDFMPFLLPLVAIGAARTDGSPRRLSYALLAVGAVVNLWGVAWGRILGW
jgi:hypothetical protein